MKEKPPITILAKHWWQYLNPFWYRRRKIIQELTNHYWKNGGEEEINKMSMDLLLYGKTKKRHQ